MNAKTQKDGYQIVDFPRVREFVIDVMLPAERKHMIHILFEADVTDVRKYREKVKSEGAAAPRSAGIPGPGSASGVPLPLVLRH